MNGYASRHSRSSIRILFLALVIPLSGCGSQSPVPDPGLIQIQSPKPVILDIDMAQEDMSAALFLLSHPNVDVRAITVSGTGEAHCGPGVAHALGLVALSGRENVPVACGRETPLAGAHEFPAAWRQRADDAYGVAIPAGGTASSLAAPDLIVDTVFKSDQAVTIVAVGPLTNIAGAMQKAPDIKARISEIYIMGGAVEVEGNVGNSGVGIQNEHAEWNIYIDPAAANIVFDSGIPITLVPLDATRDVPITRKFHAALGRNRNTPAANLVYDLLTANLDLVDSGGFQFWDSLTAALFTDERIATFKDVNLMVIEEEGPESGRTQSAANGVKIRVATRADRKQFEKLYLTVLNWSR